MQELENSIEQLIDKHGLLSFIEAFGQVCCQKSEHIFSSYQDKNLALSWQRVGEKIMRLPLGAAK